MRKNFVIAIIAILLAFGVGYSISQQDSAKPNNQALSPSSTDSGKTVDLSGQQLTTLPDSVLSQTDITVLNISNNQLTSLDGIGKLTKLEKLNVENNRLETVPADIEQLKNLKEADFSNNRLTSSDIQQLKSKLSNTDIKT
jgi:Leucine-rich repeat (LRR) protein